MKIFTTYKKLMIYLSVLYLLAVCIFMLYHRMWLSPDQFFAVAFFGSFLIGRARVFLFDWVPFVLSYLGYEFLRGVVPYINKNVHIYSMIRFDKFIFGYIPSVTFQSLFNPTNIQWYDYVSATIYIMHFITPMLVGFLFWLIDRKLFREYAVAFLVLSYAGLITFILYPAMPPWMASDFGYIPPIKQTLGTIMSHFPVTSVSFPTLYSFVGSDPVAAIPSLHAAFPLLILFFLIKKFKWVGLIFVPYVLWVWFAVIYLGEHYFIDILIGAIYAIFVFILVQKLNSRK
jgi:membrane-associated phospholipid phosphatase